MKICAIGDIHGRPTWKLVDVSKFDKIVFVADYVDSRHYSDDEIYYNLVEIIQLKKDYPDKVELLSGNHDLMYMNLGDYRFSCSGFRETMAQKLFDLFNENKELFKICYQYKNYLFSHAGLSNSFVKWFAPHIKHTYDEFVGLGDSLGDVLNDIHNSSYGYLLNVVGDSRRESKGLTYQPGGISWADRKETERDALNGFHQVVGHTPTFEIQTIEGEDDSTSITYIDCLKDKDEFY